MKKRAEPLNGIGSGSDNAKKVYRAALEAIKCLDKITQDKKAYREVFRGDAVSLRNKLKDYCERLMFYNPLEYGRKAEEVLWRKVFYEVIQVVKRNKDHIRAHGSVDVAYRTHLSAAIGYYQHLLFRLQREYSLKLSGVIDYYQLPDPRAVRRDSSNSAKAVNPTIHEWAQRACHRCLICLGDISRYICDVDRTAMPAVSNRYYHQAFMLFPGLGMPHNQLGTLSGSRYCGTEAAYHYIRCLACEKPFDGAAGNLSRLFEKNNKKYAELKRSQARDLPPDMQRHQDLKRFFTSFIKLLEILHSSDTPDKHKLQALCQDTLQDFNLCMFYEAQPMWGTSYGDPGHPTALQYMDNGIVFKIVCCLICTIYLLQRNDSQYQSAAVAFIFALSSHILNHIVLRLQSALEDKENPNKILLAGHSLCQEENYKKAQSSDEEEENVLISGVDNNDTNKTKSSISSSSSNKKVKKGSINLRQRQRRRRRRRPASLSSNEGGVMSDLDNDSDLSEGGEERGGEGSGDDEMLSSESEEDDDNDLVSYLNHTSDSDNNDDNLSETDETTSEKKTIIKQVSGGDDKDNNIMIKNKIDNKNKDKKLLRGGGNITTVVSGDSNININNSSSAKSTLSSSSSNSTTVNQLPSGGDLQHIWTTTTTGDIVGNSNVTTGTTGNTSSSTASSTTLAHLSEELFSSSLMFLGQDLTQESFYCYGGGGSGNGSSSSGHHHPHQLQDKAVSSSSLSMSSNNASAAADIENEMTVVVLPPGFNSDVEARHAADITEKLANFDIETDTDVMFTDNEQQQQFDAVLSSEEEDDSSNDGDDSDTNENSTPSPQDEQVEAEHQLARRMEVIEAEGLMSTIKIITDWMRCQPLVIAACAPSSHSLWQRMSVLLNLLPHEKDIVQHKECMSVPELSVAASGVATMLDWAQVFPLCEDVEMCQLAPFANIHAQIDFTTKHRARLSHLQESFLQICSLRRFGYFLTTIKDVEFSYQSDSGLFLVGGSSPSTNMLPTSASESASATSSTAAHHTTKTDTNSMEKMRDMENRRNQLMRDMAQLRLQAEVSELEGSVNSSSSQATFPPYVLVDAEALGSNLINIKQLADSARCILVIPIAVVDRLDLQKKESQGAREAIRWLETQLRKGNRYIRAQKTKERVATHSNGHLKKKNKEAWYMLELVNCGRYLAQQSGTFSTGHKVVVILTGHQQLTKSPLHPSIQSAKTSAQQEGVCVESVTSFMQKWKSVLQHQSVG